MKLFAKVFVAAVLNLDLAEQQNPKKLFAKVSLKEIVKESLIEFKYSGVTYLNYKNQIGDMFFTYF